MPNLTSNSFTKYGLTGVLGLVLLFGWCAIAARRHNAVVVYCAHDLVFAESILRDFEKETGIKLVIVGDTEATKSLGLVQRLLREKENPQCDVFWNNQTLGTMQLAEADILEPYKGSGFNRIPEWYKDPDGKWVGFAGRLRVWIVNTEKTVLSSHGLDCALTLSDDLSRVAIANPLYGTTLTHFSLMHKDIQQDCTERWFLEAKERGLQVVQGNATVKNLVAKGVCDFGWTDTDDFFVAKDEGYPVEMYPIEQHGPICIPNSVAIIKGTEKLTAAQTLVDYLTSKETELKLAHSQARQIPLGPIDDAKLPEEVQPLIEWAEESVDLNHPTLLQSRKACMEWLLKEYAP